MTTDPTVLLPSPLPATMGELIGAMIQRATGSPASAAEVAAYVAYVGMADADPAASHPFGDADLLADFAGLCLSRPSFQYR